MNLNSPCVSTIAKLILILISLCIPINILAQSEMEYADWLFSEQDYFRAISEYKKLFFYTEDIDTKNECLLKISKCYLKSNKFKSSIKYSSILLNQPNLSVQQINTANIFIGLSYYGLKLFSMAEDYFKKAENSDTTGFSLFYLALIDAEKSKYKEASFKYLNVYQNYPNSKLAGLSKQLSSDLLEGYKIKTKNSYLAALLSTIIPGSGQIYCNHYYDGLQAFLYVTAFAFATYASYRYDDKFSDNYVNTYLAISITSLFHIGNIIGAQRTASYYNLKHRQNFLNQIREKAFSIDDQYFK